jgi:hypothetical protein
MNDYMVQGCLEQLPVIQLIKKSLAFMESKGSSPCSQKTCQSSLNLHTLFKILTMLFFWVLTLCSLVGRYQRFGETYCLHLQG